MVLDMRVWAASNPRDSLPLNLVPTRPDQQPSLPKKDEILRKLAD